MPITIVPPAEPSPAKLFALQQSGLSLAASYEAAAGQKRAAEEQGEARQNLIAAFIASETILPSPTRAAANGATADGPAAQAPALGSSSKPGSPAALTAEASSPAAACNASTSAMDARPVAVAAPVPLPPSAHSTTGDAVAEVPVLSVDASLAAAAGSTAVESRAASALQGSSTACRSLPFVRAPAAAGPAGLEQHPAGLPPPEAAPAADQAAPPVGFRKSLSRRLSRSFRVVRTSLRRSLRRADSPPVPPRRALPDSPRGRGSPASATPHLPSIAEAEGIRMSPPAASGAAPASIAVTAAVPAGAAAGASAAAVPGPAMEHPAVQPAGHSPLAAAPGLAQQHPDGQPVGHGALAAPPGLAQQHPGGQPAGHDSMQEVDLREAPAPRPPPRRRFSGLSCACLASAPVR